MAVKKYMVKVADNLHKLIRLYCIQNELSMNAFYVKGAEKVLKEDKAVAEKKK